MDIAQIQPINLSDVNTSTETRFRILLRSINCQKLFIKTRLHHLCFSSQAKEATDMDTTNTRPSVAGSIEARSNTITNTNNTNTNTNNRNTAGKWMQ